MEPSSTCSPVDLPSAYEGRASAASSAAKHASNMYFIVDSPGVGRDSAWSRAPRTWPNPARVVAVPAVILVEAVVETRLRPVGSSPRVDGTTPNERTSHLQED